MPLMLTLQPNNNRNTCTTAINAKIPRAVIVNRFVALPPYDEALRLAWAARFPKGAGVHLRKTQKFKTEALPSAMFRFLSDGRTHANCAPDPKPTSVRPALIDLRPKAFASSFSISHHCTFSCHANSERDVRHYGRLVSDIYAGLSICVYLGNIYMIACRVAAARPRTQAASLTPVG